MPLRMVNCQGWHTEHISGKLAGDFSGVMVLRVRLIKQTSISL